MLKTFITTLLCTLLSIILICGCKPAEPKKDMLIGLWNIDGNGGEENNREQGAYLNLREDKTYTFYQPYYFDYGHWRYADNKIKLISDRKKVIYNKEWILEVVDKEKDVLKISFPFADEIRNIPAPIGDNEPEKIVYTVHKNLFLNRNEVQFDANNDPFSIPNSQWRIRADHSENCKELQQRALGNIEHLCLLFNGYNKADVTNVSWQHSPNPFILGSNGIAMQDLTNVSNAWVGTFYNSANALETYNMISKLFKEDIDIPLHYKKYPEMWFSLLRQMDSIGKQKGLCSENIH